MPACPLPPGPRGSTPPPPERVLVGAVREGVPPPPPLTARSRRGGARDPIASHPSATPPPNHEQPEDQGDQEHGPPLPLRAILERHATRARGREAVAPAERALLPQRVAIAACAPLRVVRLPPQHRPGARGRRRE